jgi:hypothetical protein
MAVLKSSPTQRARHWWDAAQCAFSSGLRGLDLAPSNSKLFEKKELYWHANLYFATTS